jgi:hypothetical protein
MVAVRRSGDEFSVLQRPLAARAMRRRLPSALPPVFSKSKLDLAYSAVCLSRRAHPAKSDIWNLRRSWAHDRADVLAALVAGTYRFSPLLRVETAAGEMVDMWSSRDAVVLKLLANHLAELLPRSTSCTHLKGHGGLKGAVRRVAEALPAHRFVMRTDVKSYYASIDHERLLQRLEVHVKDRRVLNLVYQYLKRTVEIGGTFLDIDRGLSPGCALSPVMGAFFCYELDVVMEAQAERDGLLYVRYMDDILVLAPTRWSLRRAVITVNRTLSGLGLDKHPDKTFIGPIVRGFDFLGYHLQGEPGQPGRLTLAAKTIQNFKVKMSQLYEQNRRLLRTAQGRQAVEARLRQYIHRFCGWVHGGLSHAFGIDRTTGEALLIGAGCACKLRCGSAR